ncbi:MAG: 5-aminovalerate aminotransferase DavT [Promethearchaeota archaeon]|nr:MAG: 5-aminovalerate aminotransferase DavT [Candidatus Lokiarchaeota archaeon]
MKEFEPKVLNKEELKRISSGVNGEEILEFKKHSLNNFVEPLTLIEAKEPGSPWVKVQDEEGSIKEILDCTSMNWTLALGFAHPDINYAAMEQMKRLTHVRYNCLSPARAKLANKLTQIVPGKLKGGKVAFNNEGGGLANEAAMKLAMIASRGADHFGAFWHGYHGSSLVTATLSQPIHAVTRFDSYATGHFTRMPQPYCYRCMWNYKNGLYGKKDPDCNLECFQVVEKYLKGMAPRKMAGVILEPIQGAGGHIPFPPEFLRKLKDICKEEKIHLIYDECQTCMWRTGKYFTITERYEKELGIDVSPDMMTFTKAIGGGLPLGALVASPKVRKTFTPTEEHTTFSSYPLGMTTALAAIKVIEKAKLGENCEKRGNEITKRLKELQGNYEVIGDIRGPGLFIGVEMVKDRESREPFTELVEEMVLLAPGYNLYLGESMPILSAKGELIMRNLLKIKPPLVIDEEDTEFIIENFEKILKEALKKVGE